MSRQQKQLNFIDRVGLATRVLFSSNKNTIGRGDGIELFNNLATRGGVHDWGLRTDNDQELYKGYLYSAIHNRAIATAQLATDHLKTRWDDPEKEDSHPYLDIIDKSNFSNYYFWVSQPHFLDLKGVSYILAVRNANGERYGAVQYFDVINPYNVQKNINSASGEVIYTETRDGGMRKLPEHMIIEARNFNPFDTSSGLAMIDAARDAQVLNRDASDYTRNALRDNVGQRGLLSTDVILDEKDFQNLKSGVEANSGSGVGKFIYANGGALKYSDMQIDLDKLSLDKINNVSLEGLLAVSGMSRTAFGLEQSGVTRETGKVQTDRLTRDHIIPMLQVMIDALNQDYRSKYPELYETSGKPNLYIDSPLKADREAELADANTLKAKAETVKVLIDAGFDPAEAREAVGLPEMNFVGLPTVAPATNAVTKNALADPKLDGLVAAKQASLEVDIINIQSRIVTSAAKNYETVKNALSEDELLTKAEKNEYEEELLVAISTFILGVFPLFAGQTIRQRVKEYQKPGTFNLSGAIRKLVRSHAQDVAQSHINTIMDTIYSVARKASSDGLGTAETVARIHQSYNDTISKEQARRIARTEANRSVASAQYEADKQFLSQNELGGKAFKRWVTRSSNPCSFCSELEKQTTVSPIPFNDYFVPKNSTVEVTEDNDGDSTTKTYVAGFESVGSGTLHPNCSCIYELIIKG